MATMPNRLYVCCTADHLVNVSRDLSDAIRQADSGTPVFLYRSGKSDGSKGLVLSQF